MHHLPLVFVADAADIQQSLHRFNADAARYAELAVSLLRQTTYWVYEPASQAFGPSKFVGFQNMTFPRYQAARAGDRLGASFNGTATRVAIEKLLCPYAPEPQRSAQLVR